MKNIKYNIYKVITRAWDKKSEMYKVGDKFESLEEAAEWINNNIGTHDELTYFSEYTILPVYKIEE